MEKFTLRMPTWVALFILIVLSFPVTWDIYGRWQAVRDFPQLVGYYLPLVVNWHILFFTVCLIFTAYCALTTVKINNHEIQTRHFGFLPKRGLAFSELDCAAVRGIFLGKSLVFYDKAKLKRVADVSVYSKNYKKLCEMLSNAGLEIYNSDHFKEYRAAFGAETKDS